MEIQQTKQQVYCEAERSIRAKYTGIGKLLPREKTIIIPQGEDEFTVRLFAEARDSFGKPFWKPFHSTVKRCGAEWRCVRIEPQYR